MKLDQLSWEEAVTLIHALEALVKVQGEVVYDVDGPVHLHVLKEKLERELPSLKRKYKS